MAFASLGAVVAATPGARAQTAAATGPSVTQTQQLNPPRFLVNADGTLGATVPYRPTNLTPFGISHSDCAQNIVLNFNVLLTNFVSGERVEVWASTNADCTDALARGRGAGAPTCWNVGTLTNVPVGSMSLSQPIPIYATDIAAHVDGSTPNMAYVRHGTDVCTNQSSDAQVPVTLYFIPVSSSGDNIANATPTVYKYPITVDLLGPPPPGVDANGNAGAGETLLIAAWTPNTGDRDTVGYNVYVDPIPGQEGSDAAAATTNDAGATLTLVCPDAGATSTADAGDAGDDATAADAMSIDATVEDAAASDGSMTSTDAGSNGGCYLASQPTVNPSTASGGAAVHGMCTSSVLTNSGGVVLDSGTTTTTTLVSEAGVDASVASSAGSGVSDINDAYRIKTSNSQITVAGITASQYTITGLQNFQQYNLAIAGVDGLGNVGPLSDLICATPAPVDDFWKKYQQSGGTAGGGFCALDQVGAPVQSVVGFAGVGWFALAAVRRRRRKQ